MKKNILRKTGALITLIILLAAVFTMPVYANDIHTVEIWVDIHSDGSATIKETWDITMTNSSNTEWYVAKHDLDNMEILDLVVEEIADDGTATPFETLDTWNVNASRTKKSGKCGLVETNGGYEVCWGFGELGRHSYIVSYTITNIVKGYQGGDAMSYNFLSDAAGGADILNIYFSTDDFAMEYPETKVWVFGYEAESSFADGGITILGQERFAASDYAVVMLAFEPGMLSPGDQRSEPLDEIIELNMAGSVWEENPTVSSCSSSSGTIGFGYIIGLIKFMLMIAALLWPFIFIFIFLSLGRLVSGVGSRDNLQQRIVSGSKADYCRELPFYGNLETTYARLCDIRQVKEGVIIGCFLLKWIQALQVEIVMQPAGILKQREETAMRLYPPAADMLPNELRLYNMIKEAAGPDGILQGKEFEKWARKHYSRVGSWLFSCQSAGKSELLNTGVYANIPIKKCFGLINSTVTHVTSHGEEMTNRVFGFKRYLEDFTIINEREAREVELWDQYLIFAQLLGIADRVTEQFKQLYPNYFTQVNAGGYSSTDIFVAATVSRTLAHSMYKGYSSGRSAASSGSSGSSSSGGGGSSSSSGGGGGSSGGGGAGGR